MTNTSTTYMGLQLNSPIVVAASPISSYVDRIRQAEDCGAGAMVIRSLFEEQVEETARRQDYEPEAPSSDTTRVFFPHTRDGALSEHLYWVKKTRKAVSFPLIGSINARHAAAWAKYAKALEDAGVDALELNVYTVEADLHISAHTVEERLVATVLSVVEAVDIPVAVKLSPYYSCLANVAHQLERAGVHGLVLFNRFLQPTIDPHHERLVTTQMPLSNEGDIRLPLRWVGLLAGRVDCDLALSSGVHSGLDVVRGLLAGAKVVQTASALLKQGVPYLEVMNRQLEGWMHHNGHRTIADFTGLLKDLSIEEFGAYERAQYVQMILEHR